VDRAGSRRLPGCPDKAFKDMGVNDAFGLEDFDRLRRGEQDLRGGLPGCVRLWIVVRTGEPAPRFETVEREEPARRGRDRGRRVPSAEPVGDVANGAVSRWAPDRGGASKREQVSRPGTQRQRGFQRRPPETRLALPFASASYSSISRSTAFKASSRSACVCLVGAGIRSLQVPHAD
jgi:hypothetical protein